MRLTDQIALDNAVFFNIDEFGEAHTIDGKEVVCVVDANPQTQFSGDVEGVWVSKTDIYAQTSDLESLTKGIPKPGHTLIFDNKKYTVINVSDESGITKISMQATQ